MKIFNQNVITIAPVFLFASFAIGALNYHSNKNEQIWGLQEEAMALTVSTAAHLESRDFRKKTETIALLEKVLDWKKAKVISIYGKDPLELLFQTENAESKINTSAANITEEAQQLAISMKAGQDSYVSNLIDTATGGAVIHSLAALSQNGRITGYVRVESDASSLKDSLRTIVVQSVWISFLMLVAGVLIAAVLSGLIKTKIRNLVEVVKALSSGNFNNTAALSWLRETNDLGNTFNTMSSLLKDNYEKSQNAVIELEKSRQPKHLAAVFNAEFLYDREYCFAINDFKFEISVGLADSFSSSDYFHVADQEDRLLIILGRIGAEHPEQTICLRSALLTALPGVSQNENIPQAMKQIQKIFDLDGWQSLELDKSKSFEESSLVHHCLDRESGRTLTQVSRLARGNSLIISSAADRGSRVAKLFKRMKTQEPCVIRSQLLPLIAYEQQGATIILGAK